MGLAWVGYLFAGLAFLLVGAGMQTTQTAGLALATDLSSEAARPRVVALMYVMLLLGMVGGGFAAAALLMDYSPQRLVQVVQGAAVLTAVLNLIAAWKQEPRDARWRRRKDEPAPAFGPQWRAFAGQPRVRRFLWATGLGTAAFSMQDIILEPYGGEILGLSVSATSMLTALMAGGALLAFTLAARLLTRGADPIRVAAAGALVGLPAFSCVLFAAPAEAAWMFRLGTFGIGFGGGLFAVGTLTSAMSLEDDKRHIGLALGAWGAVQATAGGTAVLAGGALRDGISHLAMSGWLGPVLQSPVTGYGTVYYLEMLLLFAALIAIGPLVRRGAVHKPSNPSAENGQRPRFGLADLPG